mgnify:CR=1 FL=1|jgi:hypothetical protein
MYAQEIQAVLGLLLAIWMMAMGMGMVVAGPKGVAAVNQSVFRLVRGFFGMIFRGIGSIIVAIGNGFKEIL